MATTSECLYRWYCSWSPLITYTLLHVSVQWGTGSEVKSSSYLQLKSRFKSQLRTFFEKKSEISQKNSECMCIRISPVVANNGIVYPSTAVLNECLGPSSSWKMYSKTSLLRPPLVLSQSGLNSEVVWLLRFVFQLVWIFISLLGFDTNWYALCVFKYITCLLYAFHYVILFLQWLFNENIEKQTQLQCIIRL